MMKDASKRILLLGANGLLGKAFVQEFNHRGLAAICLDRSACDVTDADQLAAVFDRYELQVAINCSAYTKVDLAEVERVQAFAINATGVANLARACAAHQTRLIHFSTDFVFDGTASMPYLPTDETSALSIYGQSKLRGENLLREIDPPGWMIARTSWLFGPGGPCFPKAIVERARSGQPLKIVNDQIGSPTYAPDLAAAVLDLLAANATGIRHLTNAGHCSWFDFAQALLAEFEISCPVVPITTAQFLQMRPAQAKRPAYSVMTDPQLPALLGRAMRPWQEAVSSYRAACNFVAAPVDPRMELSA